MTTTLCSGASGVDTGPAGTNTEWAKRPTRTRKTSAGMVFVSFYYYTSFIKKCPYFVETPYMASLQVFDLIGIMLLIRFRIPDHSIIAMEVVPIAALFRPERRFDAFETGIRNGTGGKPSILSRVIG